MKFNFGGHELTDRHIMYLRAVRDMTDARDPDTVHARGFRANQVTQHVQDDDPQMYKAPSMLMGLVNRGLLHCRKGWGHRGNRVNYYMMTADGRQAIMAYERWLQTEDEATKAEVKGRKSQAANGAISATERKEIRGLLRRRRAVLEAQLQQRLRELDEAVRKQVKARHRNVQEQAAKEINAAIEASNAAIREAKRLIHEVEKRHDIRCGDIGRLYTHDPVQIRNMRINSYEREIREEMARIKVDKGAVSLELEQEFLKLEEELAIGAIKSDEGKAFLERVPTVDKLLPMPDEFKALNA